VYTTSIINMVNLDGFGWTDIITDTCPMCHKGIHDKNIKLISIIRAGYLCICIKCDQTFVATNDGSVWISNPYEITFNVYDDQEPCPHNGCLSHISHRCERCGRVGGKGVAWVKVGEKYD